MSGISSRRGGDPEPRPIGLPLDPRLRQGGDHCRGGGGLLCPASEQSQGSRWTVLRGPSLAWALARRCRGRSGIPSPSATQQPNERRLWGAEAERGTLISSLTGSCSMMDGRRQKDVHYYGAVSEDCTLISMTGNCTLMGDVVNP